MRKFESSFNNLVPGLSHLVPGSCSRFHVRGLAGISERVFNKKAGVLNSLPTANPERGTWNEEPAII
jgi:hypothetical protein